MTDGTPASAGRRAGRLAGRVAGTSQPAVDASTVVLLRDGADGLEVFMLERHLASDFAGGALAFPGGKVDPADRALPGSHWRGVDPTAAAAQLGVDEASDALGFLVAAVRETFEEAGLLLGTRGASPITAEDLATPSFLEARRRMASRDEHWDWREWLDEEEVVLDLGRLALWSWWVTPPGMHRRFDTRFFVVEAPAAQTRALAHDMVETTDSRWTRPADAIEAHQAGRVTVVYPTRKNLEGLAAFTSADDCIQAARAGRVDQRRIMPRLVTDDDGRTLVQHPDGGAPEPG